MKQPTNFHCALAQAETSFQTRSNEILGDALKESFIKGMDYGVGQVLPNLQTIDAKIGNTKLSDADFRDFVATIIPDLIVRIKE